MLSKEKQLESLIRLASELNQLQDLDMVLEHVLAEARQFLGADAGSIYVVVDGNQLEFHAAQNDTLQRRRPGDKLHFSLFKMPIDSHSLSGHTAATGETLNIPDVYSLSPELPYHFDRKIDVLSGYRTHSMLTYPLRTNRGRIVGVLQLINALDDGQVVPFGADAEGQLSYFGNLAAVAVERAMMTRALILRMIGMAEMRDPEETGPHVNRVGSYAVEIYDVWARRQKIDAATVKRNCDILRMAAMLHDVGKVAISDTILRKPGKLTPEEFTVMKTHTCCGWRLFGDTTSEFEEAAAQVALSHHENWDGSGYPGFVNPATGKPLAGYETGPDTARGKKGEDIPLFGRIVKVADVYDALRAKRVYKPAMPEEQVIAKLTQEAGSAFDPAVVAALVEIRPKLNSIAASYPDHTG